MQPQRLSGKEKHQREIDCRCGEGKTLLAGALRLARLHLAHRQRHAIERLRRTDRRGKLGRRNASRLGPSRAGKIRPLTGSVVENERRLDDDHVARLEWREHHADLERHRGIGLRLVERLEVQQLFPPRHGSNPCAFLAPDNDRVGRKRQAIRGDSVVCDFAVPVTRRKMHGKHYDMEQHFIVLAGNLAPRECRILARSSGQPAHLELRVNQIAENPRVVARNPDSQGESAANRDGNERAGDRSEFGKLGRFALQRPSTRGVLGPLLPARGGRTENGAALRGRVAALFQFSSHSKKLLACPPSPDSATTEMTLSRSPTMPRLSILLTVLSVVRRAAT